MMKLPWQRGAAMPTMPRHRPWEKKELFADYRIMVAQSLRVYGPMGAEKE